MSGKVVEERLMSVSTKSLFKVITDFNDYPNFVPEVVSVKVHKGANNNSAEVTFELEILKRFQYTLAFNMKEQKEVRWSLVESNFFKRNEGGWILKAQGPNETLVKYELDVSFGFLVPGWVTKKLTETSLPKMLDNFEAQAKKL